MNSFKNEILSSFLIITGIGCFVYGQYVMSTLAFAVATIYGHIATPMKPDR
ncbi:MAG: hypothetical protein ACU841_10770 [Gammaproteobacteria bacterium]